MNFNPTNYNVHLVPDLESFRFEVKVGITLSGEGSTVELDANDLVINSVRQGERDLEYTLDAEKQSLTVDLGEEHRGEITLHIDVSGEISEKLAGLYRSPYEVDGETRYAAVTQFQESDARRVFPCVDRPGAKATFDISYLVDRDLFTISNTDIVEEEIRGDKKYVRFETTPRMSTYLVFFGIGDFEYIEGETHGKRVRVLAHPGKAEEHGSFALDFGMKTLEYCEDYYGIPYPLSKMDLIATPAFAHGAMENWGAILFRENLLLHFEDVTSKTDEIFIMMVIAHEIAHQWFGNLVTPVTWKYLWLNESFATFFGYGVVDHYYPERKIWETFITSETKGALSADAKLHTAPIERPGEGDVGMTITNAPIIYNKGGSVLRQVKGYVGDEFFQKGLNHFLNRFKYGNARSNDLWESLQEVSGKPVAKMMESWVLQEGYPLLKVKLDGTELHLEQSRFTFLPCEDDSIWDIPVSVRVFRKGREETYETLLSDRTGSIEIGEIAEGDSYIVNVDRTGFFRVQYSEDHYTSLKELVRKRRISAIDRWGIANDVYALILAKLLPVEFYLDVIDAYRMEDSRLVLSDIFDSLQNLETYLEGDRKKRLVEGASAFLGYVVKNIGMEPKDGESEDIATVRGPMIYTGALFGIEKTIEFSMQQFGRYKNGEKVDADILGEVLRVAAMQTNDFGYFLDEFSNAENEQLAVLILRAMASFTQKDAVDKVREVVFEKFPSRNRGSVINTLCKNSAAKSGMWHWYIANLDNFEKLFPFMYQSVLVNLISASLEHEEDMREFFEDYQKKNPLAKESADIGFELLEIRKRL